jgi:RimJ/RimL family protein N-acetyltransferase
MKKYVFKSDRLGFRNWIDSDVELMYPISSDKEVMEFFPSVQTHDYVADFVKRMQVEFAERGHCYFAVEKLEGEFIGFIGLHQQTFESDFTPCIDIGWRLKKSVWNQGFATEGAKRCLEYGFRELGMKSIYSIAPKVNTKSILIMEKIGMKWQKNFIFPLLQHDERLKECVLYKTEI